MRGPFWSDKPDDRNATGTCGRQNLIYGPVNLKGGVEMTPRFWDNDRGGIVCASRETVK